MSVKCPRSCLVTVNEWYGVCIQYFRAHVLAPWSQPDGVFVQVGGCSVCMSAEAGYVHLDYVSCAMVHSCFGRSERYERVCILASACVTVGGRSMCFWCVSCNVMYGLLHQIL